MCFKNKLSCSLRGENYGHLLKSACEFFKKGVQVPENLMHRTKWLLLLNQMVETYKFLGAYILGNKTLENMSRTFI